MALPAAPAKASAALPLLPLFMTVPVTSLFVAVSLLLGEWNQIGCVGALSPYGGQERIACGLNRGE